MLTHGSLFSGIGGFDLGFKRAGIQTIWQVENDPYATKVLERHWPNVKRYSDIKEIEWEDVEVPDIVSGGFPCQPVSVAGKRKGTDDERWLWPEFARCLRVLRPRYAVLENVPGILAIGFGDVLGDLAALGYDAEWDSIPAAAFGAPHLRYRVWVVAYSASDLRRTPGDARSTAFNGGGADVADANGPRPQGRNGEVLRERSGEQLIGAGGSPLADAPSERRRQSRRPSQKIFQPGTLERFTGCDSGNGNWWATESGVGKLAYGISNRVGKLKCLGNAVVPQIAEWLAKRIIDNKRKAEKG